MRIFLIMQRIWLLKMVQLMPIFLIKRDFKEWFLASIAVISATRHLWLMERLNKIFRCLNVAIISIICAWNHRIRTSLGMLSRKAWTAYYVSTNMSISNKLFNHVLNLRRELESGETREPHLDLLTGQQVLLTAMTLLKIEGEAKTATKSIQALQEFRWATRRHRARNSRNTKWDCFDMNMPWVKERCSYNITCEYSGRKYIKISN